MDDPDSLPTEPWNGPTPMPSPPGSPGTAPASGPRRGGWQPPEPEQLQASFPLYEIRGILGRGGMGAVYQGWQKSLRRLVAIKILPPDLEDNGANFAERFQREAQAMARFSHPGIVSVYDAGETADGLFYFVMEYIEGTDVQQMVKSQGPLPPEHALAITAHVCDALAYAHKRGVIHRDIKPANIMVDAEGQVKVADFGLAKVANDDSAALVTGTHVSMGTADFMAPEALYGMGAVDHRADLYAVGVMLYQMLTGEVPRGRFDLPSVQRPGLDPRFDAIVDRAMQKNPDKRYASATEIRTDLDKILTEPVPHRSAVEQAPPPPSPPPQAAVQAEPPAKASAQKATPAVMKAIAPPPAKKSRLPLSIGLAATVLVVVIGAFLWAKQSKPAGGRRSVAARTSAGGERVGADGASPSKATGADLTFGGHRFRLVEEKGLTWEEARAKAEAVGAHLANAETREKLDWVLTHFTPKVDARGYWLGGSKTSGIDAWKWHGGISIEKSLWLPGQPDVNDRAAATTLNKFGGRVGLDDGRTDTPNTAGYLIEWDDAVGTSTPATATKDAPFVNTLGMMFVPVPITGGPTSGQRVLFSIWETRVQDYEAFTGEARRKPHREIYPQTPIHPVVGVNWDDAQEFCTWLTERDRRTGKIGGAECYRLPTDHEWSCAVGIGNREDSTKTPEEKDGKIADVFPWGTVWPPPSGAGNYSGEERDQETRKGQATIPGYRDAFPNTSPVGSFPANELGLFDLGGNAREWCEDWRDGKQDVRILRGAAFEAAARLFLLSSYRDGIPPTSRLNRSGGFRVVLAPVAPGAASAVPLEPGATRLWDAPEKLPTDIVGVSWKDTALFVTDNALVRSPGNIRDLILRFSMSTIYEVESQKVGIRNVGTAKEPRKYQLQMTPRTKTIAFRVETPGGGRTLQSWPLPSPKNGGSWLQIELRAVGGDFTISADGEVLGTVHDETVGEAGHFFLSATTNGYFRDIVYVPLDKTGGGTAGEEKWIDSLAITFAKNAAAPNNPYAGILTKVPEGARVNERRDITVASQKRDGAIRVTFRGLSNRIELHARYSGDATNGQRRYAATINKNGSANIGKQLAKGGFQTLVEFKAPAGFSPDACHVAEIRVVGDLLTLSLDGAVLGSTRDADLREGQTYVAADPGMIIEKLEYLDLDAVTIPAPAASTASSASALVIDPTVELLTSPDYTWSAPVNLGPTINGDGEFSYFPSLTADGLEIAFGRRRDGEDRVCIARRPDVNSPFGPASPIPTLPPGRFLLPWLSSDGLTLLFTEANGIADIFEIRRPDRQSPWSAPAPLGPAINTNDHESAGALSPDGLTLLFSSSRPGGEGASDIWRSRRKSVNAPWETPENLGKEINTPVRENYARWVGERDAFLLSRSPMDQSRTDYYLVTPRRDGHYTVEPFKFPAPHLGEDPFWHPNTRRLIFRILNLKGGFGTSWNLWECERKPKPSSTNNAPKAAASAEPWQEMLRDPAKLVLIRSAELTAEGLRLGVNDMARCSRGENPPLNRAIRLRTTLSGMRVQIFAPDEQGTYLLSTSGQATVLTHYDNRTAKETAVRTFPLNKPLHTGQAFTLELRVVGQALIVKLNDEVLGSVTAGTLPTGDFALRALGSDTAATSALITSLEVLDLDEPSSASATEPSKATKDAPFVNSLGMKFVPVPITYSPEGHQPPFVPGAAASAGRPSQRVLFSIWETRVQDYEVFAKETKREWPKPSFVQGPTHPAVAVSWEDATAFCAWLTDRERKAGKLGANEHYRLPSDHEWSCAVGIGDQEDAAKLPGEKYRKLVDVFPWGTAWPPPARSGNYSGEEAVGGTDKSRKILAGYRDDFPDTAPVGSFPANRFGLFDLSGNAWEWCEDWYDATHEKRVQRGATFALDNRLEFLSSNRGKLTPEFRAPFNGFRVVLTPVAAGR